MDIPVDVEWTHISGEKKIEVDSSHTQCDGAKKGIIFMVKTYSCMGFLLQKTVVYFVLVYVGNRDTKYLNHHSSIQ